MLSSASVTWRGSPTGVQPWLSPVATWTWGPNSAPETPPLAIVPAICGPLPRDAVSPPTRNDDRPLAVSSKSSGRWWL